MTEIEPARRAVTPIGQLGKPPIVGSLRLYEASGKFPDTLGFFRATSPRAEHLEPLAVWMQDQVRPANAKHWVEGVQPWKPGPKDARSPDCFHLDLTDALPVILFGMDAAMESYQLNGKGGKVIRRCDGVTCTTPHPDGGLQRVPCVCAEKGLECTPKGKLFVALPMARTTGVWRVSSGSYQAVGSLGRAAKACFTAAAGAPVADGFLSIGHHKDAKGRHDYPILEPVTGEHTVSELRELATHRAEQRAAIGYGDWGSAGALPAATPAVTAGTPVSAPTRRGGGKVVDDPDQMQDRMDEWNPADDGGPRLMNLVDYEDYDGAGPDPHDDVEDAHVIPGVDDLSPVSSQKFGALAKSVRLDGKTVTAVARSWLVASRGVDQATVNGMRYKQLVGSWPVEMAMVAAVMEEGEVPTVDVLDAFAAMVESD